jgi:hypothetical protein
MTMTVDRPAALGEIPAPPPCPSWCERDNDFKTRTSWRRSHHRLRQVTVAEVKHVPVEVFVMLTCSDTFYGDRWEPRSSTQIEMGPSAGTVFADADSRFAVYGLIAVAALISPEVEDAVTAAALLTGPLTRSPEVTPGEDQ